MAFSQSEIDILKRAMATGARVVKYADKTVEYRDLAEMERVLSRMEAEVNPTRRRNPLGRFIPVRTTKGL